MNKVFGYIAGAITSGAKLSRMFIWDALYGAQRPDQPAMQHKYGYSVEMLMKLVSEAGFRNVVSVDPRYHFPSRDMRIEGIK